MTPLGSASSALPSLWLRVVHTNDVYELDNFSHLKTLVEAHTQKPNPIQTSGDTGSSSEQPDGPHRTLVTLGGDFLAPSLLSSLDHGVGMVDCMNEAGVSHVCFGNHECDIQADALKKRIEQSRFGWVNSNMQELNGKLQVQTPEYDIVTVSNSQGITKRVAILGLLTPDPALYRPGSFKGAAIEPVIPTAQRLVNQLKNDKQVDFILPLTHQSLANDRQFAEHFGGDCFPIILGGHEHELHDESRNQSRILKVGHDAINTGIIDIQWFPESEAPVVHCKTIPTNSFEPDAAMANRIKGHKRVLDQLETTRLFRIQNWLDRKMERCGVLPSNHVIPTTAESQKSSAEPHVMSTEANRLGLSTGTTALASVLRMGLRCQCCIINAGCVRGNRRYPPDHEFFTWKDLKAEMPFPTEMVVSKIPGRVLEATITHSRKGACNKPKPISRGGYLHHCTNMHYNNEMRSIETIQGIPFDPDQEYWTAYPKQFLEGIDNHEPLLEWVADQKKESEDAKKRGIACANDFEVLMEGDHGIPAKLVIVQVFSALVWLQLGSFSDLDTDANGHISREEVKKRFSQVYKCDEIDLDLVVDNIMSVADFDGSGSISPLEMLVVHFAATDILNHISTQGKE